MARACCSPSATRPPGASSSGTRRPAARPLRCRSPTGPCPSTPTSAPARTATSWPSTRAARASRAGTRSTRTRRRTTRSAAAATSTSSTSTTERERRLPGSGVLPAVWKDGLAFARVYSSKKIVLYHRTGGATSRRMPGGPANGRPNGLDLYGRRLAFGWEYPGRYDGPASDLRMDDVADGPRALIDTLRRRRPDHDLAHRAGVRGREAVLREALPGRRERLPAPRRADARALLDRRDARARRSAARTSGRRAARA